MSDSTTVEHPRTERRIGIDTPQGRFEVWTEQVGATSDTHPTVLVLHGGPGATHTYLLTLADHLPDAGFPVVFYDQLGSGASDRPEEPAAQDLWDVTRFADEVEQVRVALVADGAVGAGGLVIYGQSWGGILAMEYGVVHADAGDLGERVRGLVISNMMASIEAYGRYAEEVLKPGLDPAVVAEIERMEAEGLTETEEYDALLTEHVYVHHLVRMPVEQWPEHLARGLGEINRDIYVPMQGPSELGTSGKLETWDRFEDLARIGVPTLVVGATHDTMDPAHLAAMAEQLPAGEFLLCPDGSHCALDDDTAHYVPGLLAFLDGLVGRG